MHDNFFHLLKTEPKDWASAITRLQTGSKETTSDEEKQESEQLLNKKGNVLSI
jgi:hypothetical protein